MAGGDRARLERSMPKHELILRTAGRLFTQQGFHATSVREIGEAAGVSQSALYYHAYSKTQILIDLNDRFMERLVSTLQRIEAQPDPPPRKIELIIGAFFGSFFRRRRRTPGRGSRGAPRASVPAPEADENRAASGRHRRRNHRHGTPTRHQLRNNRSWSPSYQGSLGEQRSRNQQLLDLTRAFLE
jgi:AcrR family transcriptional regulator